MLFCTQKFLLFFAAVFAVYWAIPWRRPRVWLLLGASFVFYRSWNPTLAWLIAGTSAMDYAIALGLERTGSVPRRRLLLSLSLAVNLGLLAALKYANFFLDSLAQVLHTLGAGAAFRPLEVILPVGISFYTFEAISYTLDVYRRRIRAEPSLANFMLFISFFPHLVAGPIVRARDFLPQVPRPKRWDWLRFQLGAQLVLLGLFKKMAIADRMALYADPVFAHPHMYGSLAVWLAALAYAIQIYCDFSGYSDLAVGCAHLLGYKLTRNFRLPYLAANVGEFWHRWHISLSSWLRDYLFIPLGGSRGTRRETARNLVVTMVLGGLWHGASWTFAAWGLYHGLALVGHRAFRGATAGYTTLHRLLEGSAGTMARVAATFLAVLVGWVMFRAQSFGIAAMMLRRMVVPSVGKGLPLPAAMLVGTVLLVVLAHGLAARERVVPRLLARLPAPALGFGYAAVLGLALVLAPDAGKTFIYFQF